MNTGMSTERNGAGIGVRPKGVETIAGTLPAVPNHVVLVGVVIVKVFVAASREADGVSARSARELVTEAAAKVGKLCESAEDDVVRVYGALRIRVGRGGSGLAVADA